MTSRKRHPQPLVSVVIVNYNVRDFLHHAIVSLTKALKGLSSEILVVDNASDDRSEDMVKKTFPRVRVFASPVNLGFAKGNNLALRHARGQYILLINPDTLVQEDTIRTMIGFFEAHPDVGLAGCKILNPDGSFQLPCRRSFPRPWVAFTKMTGLSRLFPQSRLGSGGNPLDAVLLPASARAQGKRAIRAEEPVPLCRKPADDSPSRGSGGLSPQNRAHP